MSAVTLGRVGRDVPLGTITSMSVAGRKLSLTGVRKDATEAEMDVLISQLSGLGQDPDVSTPVTLPPRGRSREGLYLPRTVTVGPIGLDEKGGGMLPWSASFEAVGSFAAPLCESTLVWDVLANTASVALSGVQPLHFIPNEATGHWAGLPLNDYEAPLTSGVHRWVDDDGDIGRVRSAELNPLPKDVDATYSIPPTAWYRGSSTVRVDQGAGLRAVVGTEVPAGVGPYEWELSNGAFRVRPVEVGSDLVEFGIFQRNNSTGVGSWATRTVRLQYQAPYRSSGLGVFTVSRIENMAVLRNDPEISIVRLTCTATASATGDTTRMLDVTISLARGAHFARVQWRSSPQTSTNGLGSVTPVWAAPGTPEEGGVRADANGYPWMHLWSGRQTTVSGSSLGLYNRGEAFDFGIGLTPDPAKYTLPPTTGTNVANPTPKNDPTNPLWLGRQFFCAMDETQRVVAR